MTNLHRIDQHARQPKWNLLGELLSVHRDLEAVAKVNVDDLARAAVEHQVARVPVAETENVADHRHDGERARAVGAAVQPHLRARTQKY
jgi:hypothetical protein